MGLSHALFPIIGLHVAIIATLKRASYRRQATKFRHGSSGVRFTPVLLALCWETLKKIALLLLAPLARRPLNDLATAVDFFTGSESCGRSARQVAQYGSRRLRIRPNQVTV